jgi:hypothetical protein
MTPNNVFYAFTRWRASGLLKTNVMIHHIGGALVIGFALSSGGNTQHFDSREISQLSEVICDPLKYQSFEL